MENKDLFNLSSEMDLMERWLESPYARFSEMTQRAIDAYDAAVSKMSVPSHSFFTAEQVDTIRVRVLSVITRLRALPCER